MTDGKRPANISNNPGFKTYIERIELSVNTVRMKKTNKYKLQKLLLSSFKFMMQQ